MQIYIVLLIINFMTHFLVLFFRTTVKTKCKIIENDTDETKFGLLRVVSIIPKFKMTPSF